MRPMPPRGGPAARTGALPTPYSDWKQVALVRNQAVGSDGIRDQEGRSGADGADLRRVARASTPADLPPCAWSHSSAAVDAFFASRAALAFRLHCAYQGQQDQQAAAVRS